MTKINIPDAFIKQLRNELANVSGIVLWHVTGTWARDGRVGTFDHIVEAMSALSAVVKVWEHEDDRDLRTIKVEWLCSHEAVLRHENND